MQTIKKSKIFNLISIFSAILIFSTSLFAADLSIQGPNSKIKITFNAEGVPHIQAKTEKDAYFGLGYIEAKMRFWNMDVNRKTAQGRLSELVGVRALTQDGQVRTFKVKEKYVEPTFALGNQKIKDVLQAYSDGVNSYIMNPQNPLPTEYNDLKLTRASIEAWQPIDSVYVIANILLSLALDTTDINRSLALSDWQAKLGQSNGLKLLTEDLDRTQSMDPLRSASSPNFLSQLLSADDFGIINKLVFNDDQTKSNFFKGFESPPFNAINSDQLNWTFKNNDEDGYAQASNWIIIGGNKSTTRMPILANDPHLSLSAPSIWFQYAMTVPGKFKISGFQINGLPFPTVFETQYLAVGVTNSTVDLNDIYLEQFGSPDASGNPTVLFNGQYVPVVKTQVTLKANLRQSMDNVVPVTTVNVVDVPHHGPIIQMLSATQGLSLKSAAFTPSYGLNSVIPLRDARNFQQARKAVLTLKEAGQNWSIVDSKGNFGYVTSAVIPIREDLQQGLVIPSLTPDLIRDGTRTLPNEWVANDGADPLNPRSFKILSDNELPQELNPRRGYIVNGNNDQVGITDDNKPFNQLRSGGGIYYTGNSFADMRVSQLIKKVEQKIAKNQKLSPKDVERIQLNRQDRVAEILTPHIVAAFDHANSVSAPQALKDLINANPKITEAVNEYLKKWNFDTPTGIPEGYDIGDNSSRLKDSSERQIRNSVSTTLFYLTAHQLIKNTVDNTLIAKGLASIPSRNTGGRRFLGHILENYDTNQGVGSSGIDFFQQGVPAGLSANDRRDYIILTSLQQAITRLGSVEFANVFNQSTDLRDYRWGKLSKVRVLHAFNVDSSLPQNRNIPPAGGFSDLGPTLPGVARGGTSSTINVARGVVTISNPNAFNYSFGPSLRRILEVTRHGFESKTIMPGGVSGDLSSPFYSNQFGRWLVGDYFKNEEK